MDDVLHEERLGLDRRKATFRARLADIPSGTFVRYRLDWAPARPYLVIGERLLVWDTAGYRALVSPSCIADDVGVLTPPSIVAVLSAGYRPMLHHTAARLLA